MSKIFIFYYMLPPVTLLLTHEYKKYNSDSKLQYGIMWAKYTQIYLKCRHRSLFLHFVLSQFKPVNIHTFPKTYFNTARPQNISTSKSISPYNCHPLCITIISALALIFQPPSQNLSHALCVSLPIAWQCQSTRNTSSETFSNRFSISSVACTSLWRKRKKKTRNQEQPQLCKSNWGIIVDSEIGIWAADTRQEHECYLQL